MQENCTYGSVRGSDIPSQVEILERSVELSTRLIRMSKKIGLKDAQAILMDAGFSNIEAIAQKDLWDGFLHNDQENVGKVALITINGDERFRENDSFSKESKIRIWYHAYR